MFKQKDFLWIEEALKKRKESITKLEYKMNLK